MENDKKRNGFAGGLGFILAAAGSAIGLGNLWSFPHKTSQLHLMRGQPMICCFPAAVAAVDRKREKEDRFSWKFLDMIDHFV